MQCGWAILYCRLWPFRFCSIFPHYLIKGTIFEKKKYSNTRCVFIFSTTLSETFLILRRIERGNIKMYIGLHIMYPLFLSYLKKKLNFLDRFLKNTRKYSNFMKICPVRVELFHAEGRTDRLMDGRTERQIWRI